MQYIARDKRYTLYQSLFCSDIDCGSLSNPENGAVQWNSTAYNSVATYTCNTGYDLEGGRTRMCSEGGTWSNSEPLCNGEGHHMQNVLLCMFIHM